MKLNTDKELVQDILKSLNENKKTYGKCYCPCVSPRLYTKENSEDYVCPCKDFRENIEIGKECHCGLYIKD